MPENSNIPKHWKSAKLGDVCAYSKGKMPKVLKEEKSKNCSIPYINIKAFEKGIFAEYTDGEKCNLCNDDDLLIVWDGARCGLIGKAKKGAVGSTLMKILPKENIYKEYLYHFISSKFWTLNTKPRGVGIPHIEPSLLWNFELVLPPLPEQQAIVSKIEELLSELENGKQQLRTAQEQLKIYRQSLLKGAFEGKLTNKKIKDGELPKGWKWVKIEIFLSDKKKGMATGPFGTMLKTSEHQPDGVPVLGIENIGEGVFQMPNKIFVTNEKAIELKNFRVQENDIIISRSGTVGEICLLPKRMENSIISTNLIRVRLNQNIVFPKYFVYLFQGGKVRQQVFDLCKGSSRVFLNQTILNSLSFPYCSIEEQKLIVDELESKLTVCDKIEETISQSLLQAETLRQSILKRAFEGRLV
jgi:type I restriction enzyme S subunit